MKNNLVLLLVLLAAGCTHDEQKPAAEPGDVIWAYATRGPIHSSPAVGPDGVAYIGSDDGYLYAIHPNGTEKWKYRVGESIHSSPAIGPDGTIYFTGGGQLFALHSNGNKKWSHFFEEGLPPSSSPAIGPDGSIFAGSNTGLYAFEENGKTSWVFRPGYNPFYSPSLGGDGNLYVGCTTGIWALSQKGEKKWFIEFGPEVQNSLAASQHIPPCINEVYSEFGLLDSREILRWFKEKGHTFFLPPAMGADGLLYLELEQEEGPAFCALNPEEGIIHWSRQLEGRLSTTPAIGNDGLIYLACSQGVFYALGRDGATAWDCKLGGKVHRSSPAIGKDGTLYLGCEDGRLYAIASSSTGLADSPWPKYRQNNFSSGSAGQLPERFITRNEGYRPVK